MTRAQRFFLLSLTGLMLAACTATRPPAYRLPDADSLVAGEEITVGRNENLYTIAQKHGAKIREIIALNNLTPPYAIKPGQTLTLPAKDRYAAPTPKAAPLDRIDKGYLGPKTSAPVGGSSWGGDVTSAPLDAPATAAATTTSRTPTSLATPVTEEPLAPAADTPKVAPKVSNFSAQTESKPLTQTQEIDFPSLSLPSTKTHAAPAQPEAEKPAPAATSSASGAVPSFGWPVRGTVISAYGPKGKGLDNDGINIAAPKGSPVKAAEGGMVAYAGNEMKGFGNLVLIRHEGGWVTAYAHLDRLVVAKDAVVAKGDMIGTIGNSGGVGSPQLHFEARQEGKPVDPELVLK